MVNRPEIYVTDLGNLNVSAWMMERIHANARAGHTRFNLRLWSYVIRKFVGVEPPAAYRL